MHKNEFDSNKKTLELYENRLCSLQHLIKP